MRMVLEDGVLRAAAELLGSAGVFEQGTFLEAQFGDRYMALTGLDRFNVLERFGMFVSEVCGD